MKTIVSIISDQTIPNFLFIKEMYEEGDKLLFLLSQGDKRIGQVVAIQDTLKLWDEVDVIFSSDGDAVLPEKLEDLKGKLSEEEKYYVNLTGGTKYMSLYVEKLFSNYDSEFYYIPFPKNEIIRLDTNEIISIDYRVTIEEYMQLYGLPIKSGELVKSQTYTSELYNYYSDFSKDDYGILELLRQYRDVKKIDIQVIEKYGLLKGNNELPIIPDLDEFISSIDFPKITEGWLYKDEIKYITGGWFEEYVYHWVKDNICPDDLKIGLEIKRAKATNQNDLDVVFTLGNKLFVIECKTGVGKERQFKEFVYKACSLKEYLLGLSGKSYIFSLNSYDDNLERSAKNMGITYRTKEYFTDEKNKTLLVDEIKEYASV